MQTLASRCQGATAPRSQGNQTLSAPLALSTSLPPETNTLILAEVACRGVVVHQVTDLPDRIASLSGRREFL